MLIFAVPGIFLTRYRPRRSLAAAGPLVALFGLLLLSAAPLAANSVVSWGRQVLPPPGELTPLMDVSAGHEFNLGLRPDGTVVAWGANNYREAMVPAGLDEVIAIATGSTHALALRQDGSVVAWGDNRQQQASLPDGLVDVSAIAAGHAHSVALHSDGTITAWGSDRFNQIDIPADLENVAELAAGLFHTLALRRDGTVVGWGLDSDGQATVPADLTNVVAIAAGGFHSLALRSDGTLVAWGNNDFGQAAPPAGLPPVIRIDAGEDHSLALLENGEVYVWGRNHYGQTDLPAGLTDIRRIAAGSHHNLVLLQDGGTMAWGNNSSGQALNQEDLQDVVAVEAWENHTVALKNDGTIFWWGVNWGIEPEQIELRNIVAVAAGRAHGLALREDGTVIGWGDNLYGQASPPEDLEDVVAIAAGEFHSLALRNDGTVFAWGNNFQGQAIVPDRLNKIVAIAAGQEHSAALNHGGLVFVWGNNFYRQREVPTDLDDAVSIASGSYHNVALRANGTMLAWGGDFFNQTALPRGLSDVVGVDASRSHTVAIRENRTAVSWGSNHYSQSTIPGGLDDVVDIAAGGARTIVVTGELQPPKFYSSFDSRLVPAGEDIFLMPRASGTSPLLYQWMKNGRPIPGATGPALSLPSVAATDSGTYSLILANPVGNISSRRFSIEVEDPAVTMSANPQVAVIGGSATFIARAHGTGPFMYQWYKDGEPLSGADEPTLLFETIQEDDPGIYSVEVSNDISSAVSDPINFLIQPEIRQHPPETVPARIGERTTLSVDVIGSPPLEVQWYFEGAPIADATEATLVLENVSVNDSGVYSAVVSNPAGRVVSESSLLEIVPHLILQPESQVFSDFGGTAVFEVRATGTPPLSYHWFKNGAPFAQTNDPRLVIERVRATDAGEYYVVVANPVGRIESEHANLMLPPDIIGHPRSQTVRAGEPVELNVRATGGQPLEYQWLKDEEPIPGAQSAQLQLDSVDGADTARYSAIVSNPVGSATSQAGTLSVSPDIIQQPEAQVLTEGGTIQLTVEAEGSRPLFYQWAKDGSTLAGTEEPIFTIGNATTEDSGYYFVIVSNAAGIAISDTIEVRVESR